VMVRSSHIGDGAMYISNHAGNRATEMTWPRRDVDVESC
jgi:hypothetical protein